MVTSIKTLLVTILFRPQVFTEACHSSCVFRLIRMKCIPDILNHSVKDSHEICNRKKTIKDIVQKNTKECRLCVMLLWTKNVNLHQRKRQSEIVENIPDVLISIFILCIFTTY